MEEVNAHIHSPWSFSAFDNLRQAFEAARDEGVKVLGINDFNTTGGYPEFDKLGREFKIYPLFNIEFTGLMEEERQKGIRINDPVNPGRIYFSGKGLDFPVTGNGIAERMHEIREKCQDQVKAMADRLNLHLSSLGSGITIEFDEVRGLARDVVRERHLARALRLKIAGTYPGPREFLSFLRELYGTEPRSGLNNIADIENEIRNRLLKSGGVAFVEEDNSAFPPLGEIISMIGGLGGIPCYPVLLDDSNGHFTEFESDREELLYRLEELEVACIELIPVRNDLRVLKDFVKFFREKGFAVLFGTEHNALPAGPLRVSARGNVPLDPYLNETAWKGACVVAAHQHLRKLGAGHGYFPGMERKKIRTEFEELGEVVILRYIL